MLKIMKTLLGIESKPRSLEENIPNLLAAMGRSFFLSPEDMKTIKKLKLSREDTNMVYSGLTGLGICLSLEAIHHAVHRVVLNSMEADNIIQQIVKDTQAAFVQQSLDDGAPLDLVTYINTLIPPLGEDMGNYILNPKESFPGNTWGILSIVLWRVFGEQKTHSIIKKTGFFEYMRIMAPFSSQFLLLVKSSTVQGGDIANTLDKILRSPMGSQYGI